MHAEKFCCFMRVPVSTKLSDTLFYHTLRIQARSDNYLLNPYVFRSITIGVFAYAKDKNNCQNRNKHDLLFLDAFCFKASSVEIKNCSISRRVSL